MEELGLSSITERPWRITYVDLLCTPGLLRGGCAVAGLVRVRSRLPANHHLGIVVFCSASNAVTGEGIEEGVSWLATNVVKAEKAAKKSKK